MYWLYGSLAVVTVKAGDKILDMYHSESLLADPPRMSATLCSLSALHKELVAADDPGDFLKNAVVPSPSNGKPARLSAEAMNIVLQTMKVRPHLVGALLFCAYYPMLRPLKREERSSRGNEISYCLGVETSEEGWSASLVIYGRRGERDAEKQFEVELLPVEEFRDTLMVEDIVAQLGNTGGR